MKAAVLATKDTFLKRIIAKSLQIAKAYMNWTKMEIYVFVYKMLHLTSKIQFVNAILGIINLIGNAFPHLAMAT